MNERIDANKECGPVMYGDMENPLCGSVDINSDAVVIAYC
jgi:hypothetical protein